jgi:hypothetical protein
MKMTEAQTYSWIFYAVALASQSEPVNCAGIESVADGINHAVPTQKEMKTSLAWAVAHNLIQKEGKRYRLTEDGKKLLEGASTGTTMKTWKNLESKFGQLGAGNSTQLDPRTMST